MVEFSFVFDTRIRHILERDYTELQQLSPRTSTKAVVVLSGAIIEGLLFDALVASGKWSFEEACQNFLKDMIGPAKNRGIITEDRLTDVSRKYRNLIHPGREIKERMVFDVNDAVLARTAVDIIAREVCNWANAEQKQRRLRKFLTQLDEDQAEFLKLFGTLHPSDSNEFDHPFLTYSVYRSTDSLTANGVLIKEMNGEDGAQQERVSLVTEAVAPVEELVIKGHLQRTSVTLDYRNIAASGMGGSGAPATNRVLPMRLPRSETALRSANTIAYLIEVKKNQAVVDESTEVVIALTDVLQSRRASFTMTLPGKDPESFPDRGVGDVWRFERNGMKYRMALLEVSFITGRAKLEVRVDPDAV